MFKISLKCDKYLWVNKRPSKIKLRKKHILVLFIKGIPQHFGKYVYILSAELASKINATLASEL